MGGAQRYPSILVREDDGFRKRAQPILLAITLPASALSQSRSVAALAFHDLVALLDQALAFAIFALGFLLDVRAFFIWHVGLQGEFARWIATERLRLERLSP
jgi:hypothetical protein